MVRCSVTTRALGRAAWPRLHTPRRCCCCAWPAALGRLGYEPQQGDEWSRAPSPFPHGEVRPVGASAALERPGRVARGKGNKGRGGRAGAVARAQERSQRRPSYHRRWHHLDKEEAVAGAHRAGRARLFAVAVARCARALGGAMIGAGCEMRMELPPAPMSRAWCLQSHERPADARAALALVAMPYCAALARRAAAVPQPPACFGRASTRPSLASLCSISGGVLHARRDTIGRRPPSAFSRRAPVGS